MGRMHTRIYFGYERVHANSAIRRACYLARMLIVLFGAHANSTIRRACYSARMLIVLFGAHANSTIRRACYSACMLIVLFGAHAIRRACYFVDSMLREFWKIMYIRSVDFPLL